MIAANITNLDILKKRVIVTGANGFIGRHLVENLLSAGAPVVVVTRNPRKLPEHWHGKVDVAVADIGDRGSLQQLFGETIYHLAGELRSKNDFWSTNVIGTQNIVELCQRNKIKRIIYLSSVGVIGARGRGAIDETDPCRPRNEYEKSKLAAERLILAADGQGDVSTVALRPSIVYGEKARSETDTFLALLRAIVTNRFLYIGSKDNLYNIIYVKNVIAALRHLDTIGAHGQAYIINEAITWEKFSNVVKSRLGVVSRTYTLPRMLAWPLALIGTAGMKLGIKMPFSFSRYRTLACGLNFCADKIQKELNFSMPYSNLAGLNQTIDHYKRIGALK